MWFSIPYVGGYLWEQSYIRKHLQDHKMNYTFNIISSSKSQEISEVLESSWLYSFSLETGKARFWKLCLSVLTPPQAPSVPYNTFFPLPNVSHPLLLFFCRTCEISKVRAVYPCLTNLSAQSITASPQSGWEHRWILPCPSSQVFQPREGGMHHPTNQDPPRAHTWAQDARNAPKVPP